MREALRLIGKIVSGITMISLAVAAGIWGYLALIAYLDARKVAGTAQKPIATAIEKVDCVLSAALNKEVINPELTPEEQNVLAIAAGVAIDREGEVSQCIEDVEIELVDAYIRLKSQYPKRSYEDLVVRSDIWWPSDLKRPWYWRDRPVCLLRGGREATINRLKPIIKQRLEEGLRPGCADKIERAGLHLGGWVAREGKAQARIATYPEDKGWKAKEASTEGRVCQTKFRCSPRR